MCRGEMASEIPKLFDAFGPQLNTFISDGNLLQYFGRRLLQFEYKKTVSNLVVSGSVKSLTKLCSAAYFLQELHSVTPL